MTALATFVYSATLFVATVGFVIAVNIIFNRKD